MCSSHWKLQQFDVIRWHGRWQCSVLNIYTVQQLSNWADGHLFLLGIWANTIYVVYYMNTGIWISHFKTINLSKVWLVLSRKDIIGTIVNSRRQKGTYIFFLIWNPEGHCRTVPKKKDQKCYYFQNMYVSNIFLCFVWEL